MGSCRRTTIDVVALLSSPTLFVRAYCFFCSTLFVRLALKVFLSQAKLWCCILNAVLICYETLIAAALSLWRAPFCRATAAILKAATTSQQEIGESSTATAGAEAA